METAQIGSGVRKVLMAEALESDPDTDPDLFGERDLTEALGLAHDLGHPPFGHEGEAALNYCVLRASGRRQGFEANGQTLRLLARLESHTPGYGLDLTRRTLLGILKYPVPYRDLQPKAFPPFQPSPLYLRPWRPPKCYHDEEDEVVSWLLEPFSEEDRAYLQVFEAPVGLTVGQPLHRTLDSALLEIADDIAYGTHDLEDGVALGLIRPEMLREGDPSCEALFRTSWGRRAGLASFGTAVFDPLQRKTAVGALVNAFVTSVRRITREPSLHPMVGTDIVLDPDAQVLLERLKAVVQRHMIDIPQVRTIRFRAQQMLLRLFEAYLSDPIHLLPREFAERVERGEADFRVVADYVSGMTDAYATRAYARLYLPTADPSFERM
jgi:dGTPase